MSMFKNKDNGMKAESSEEFQARGGNVVKLEFVAPTERKQRIPRRQKPDRVMDLSELPQALKIRYGIKD